MSVSSAAVSGVPVEFDHYSDDFFDSPYETYRRLRDEAPVYYSPRYEFWALSRYEDVAPALKDFQTYSSAKGITLDMVRAAERGIEPPKMIITCDPPEHHRLRKLVNRVFTPRAVASLELMVRETIDRVLESVDPSSFDVVADFAAKFPAEVINTMLGVPPEHRQQLRIWLDTALERQHGSATPSNESIDALIALAGFYYQFVQQRRAAPHDDMTSRLIEAEITDDDGKVRKLDDIEIASFASLIGGAGTETVTKLVGNAAVLFADNPAEWQKLGNDRSKIPAAVEEVLRYENPSQYQIRYSTRDIHLYGNTIPAGSAVMLINGSASRDERVFPEPDRFDIDRQRTFGFNIGFGYGVHSCLGAALARLESRIAIEALLEMMPGYEIDRSGMRRVHMSNVCGFKNVPVRAVVG